MGYSQRSRKESDKTERLNNNDIDQETHTAGHGLQDLGFACVWESKPMTFHSRGTWKAGWEHICLEGPQQHVTHPSSSLNMEGCLQSVGKGAVPLQGLIHPSRAGLPSLG